ERVPVDPVEEGALVEELPVPPLVVVETASWACANCAQAASTLTVISRLGNRLILPAAPFEPRLEQETSKPIVIEACSNLLSPWFGSNFLCPSWPTSSNEPRITSSAMSILGPGPALHRIAIRPH